MKRFIKILLMLLTMLGFSMVVNAQGTPPQEINDALNNLNTRLGTNLTLNDLQSFEWEARTYNDTSLDCAQPNTTYTQVVTDGYRFLLEYNNVVYDYRVTEDGTSVILCNEAIINQTAQNACGDTVTVAEGDTLFEIARRCGTTVNALVVANEDIINANEILFVGTVLTIPNPDSITIDESSTMTIYPLSGVAGSQVTITLNGFPANANVSLGLGVPESEYTLTRTERTDAFGGLVTQMRIPSDSTSNQSWVFVATLTNSTDEVISTPFFVSGIDNTFEEVNIFMLQTETGGQVGCGDTLIPISVSVEPTVAPMTAAYEQLFNIDQQNYQGLYNALSESDLTLASASIIDGVATVYLTGTFQFAGACDTPRVRAQLEQIALQYSTVDSVNIFINDQALDDILSAQ